MKHPLTILMLSLIVSLPAAGCRSLTGSKSEEQGVPKPKVDWSEKLLPKSIEEAPTGTSDRAREIERSLGLGR